MAHSIIDEETLETVAYQRSKIWAKFLTDVEQSADSELGELIDLNKAEQTFQHEDEDSLRGFDEAEEDNVADDINTTACMTKAELTQVLFHADDKDKEAEIKQMLDETMPIIEEHTRKWKAAGLDRILDTFDAQKIERHVGDWMRRHNSNYGDTGMPELTPDKAQRQRYRAADNPTSPKSDNDSDAESMHSVDTARYIRSSRKRNPSSTVKCSPMTTIKMYRTVPRKRDELRAKYNEYAEDREHRHHMQALMHRRDQLHRRRRERELIFHTSPRCYPYSMTDSATVQKRRKQLRKRCESSSLYPSYSSSEDEDHAHGHCDCNACVRRAFSRTAYPYYTYRSHASHSYSRHEYPRNHLEHGSRSMQSMVHFKHNVWQMRRQLACEEDLRPRLMEDECSCCNSDRLCSNAVHIANSSTEEWLVDNKSSPDDRPAPKPQKKRKANLLPNALLKESIQEADEFNIKPRAESKQTLKKEAESKKSKTLVSFSTEEQPKASKNKKINSDASADNNKSKVNFSIEEQPKATKNKRNNSEASGDNDKSKVKFLIEEQPKARNNKKNNSKATADSDKSKARTTSTQKASAQQNKTEKKSRKVKAAKSKTNKNEVDSEDEMQRALAFSVETYKQEQKRTQKQNKSSLKTNTVESPQFPEQSSFNSHSVACNSTALSNHTASSRALKQTAVESINLSMPSPKGSLKNSWNTTDCDADCTVVTSTTMGAEANTLVATPTVSNPETEIKLTKKGILLYAPSKEDTMERKKFTLTEDCLCPIIGKSRAQKLLKYHMGSRSFDTRYSVYYRPTPKLFAALSAGSKSADLESSSSSDSDMDVFERVERYGEVYTVLEK